MTDSSVEIRVHSQALGYFDELSKLRRSINGHFQHSQSENKPLAQFENTGSLFDFYAVIRFAALPRREKKSRRIPIYDSLRYRHFEYLAKIPP